MIYRDGKPCIEPIEIEHGIPIPEMAIRRSSPVTEAARKMKIGDSIMVPYSRGSIASMMVKATGFRFTQLRIGSKLRIWRIK